MTGDSQKTGSSESTGKIANAPAKQVRLAAMLAAVIDKYQTSGDFNGLPIHQLKRSLTLTRDIRDLIRERAVDLVRGDGHPNPHIKAFPADTADRQLAMIEAEGLGLASSDGLHCFCRITKLTIGQTDSASLSGQPKRSCAPFSCSSTS